VSPTSLFRIATLALAVALGASAQPRPVREVRIKSLWGGLGPSGETNLSLKSADGLLDRDKAQALAMSLGAPAIAGPELDNLGITPQWLSLTLTQAGNRRMISRGAPNQQELYRKSCTDPAVVRRVIPLLFSFSRTDDYPRIEVTVVFDGGETWTASSHSQYQFMLPWSVQGAGAGKETCNANIARAVAALMLRKATNRERLLGESMAEELADAMMRHIKSRWDLMDVENRGSNSSGFAQRTVHRGKR